METRHLAAVGSREIEDKRKDWVPCSWKDSGSSVRRVWYSFTDPEAKAMERRLSGQLVMKNDKGKWVFLRELNIAFKMQTWALGSWHSSRPSIMTTRGQAVESKNPESARFRMGSLRRDENWASRESLKIRGCRSMAWIIDSLSSGMWSAGWYAIVGISWLAVLRDGSVLEKKKLVGRRFSSANCTAMLRAIVDFPIPASHNRHVWILGTINPFSDILYDGEMGVRIGIIEVSGIVEGRGFTNPGSIPLFRWIAFCGSCALSHRQIWWYSSPGCS